MGCQERWIDKPVNNVSRVCLQFGAALLECCLGWFLVLGISDIGGRTSESVAESVGSVRILFLLSPRDAVSHQF